MCKNNLKNVFFDSLILYSIFLLIFNFLILFLYIVVIDDDHVFHYLLFWRMYNHILAIYVAGLFFSREFHFEG